MDRKSCGCYTAVDHNNKKIRYHCKKHCEKVLNREWFECQGH